MIDGDLSQVAHSNIRVAGGAGALAARQTAYQELRRSTLACMMWEDNAYISGKSIYENIKELVAKCDPLQVANLAIEIRQKQGIRHVPLVLLRELARLPHARKIVGAALPHVCLRADDLTEFLAIYWKDKKEPLAAQVKKGLAEALTKFDAYQLAKYKDVGKTVALRDVMHLVHAKPADAPQRPGLKAWDREARRLEKKGILALKEKSKGEQLFEQLSNNTLPTPETREVLLSAARTDEEKKNAFIELMRNRKLPAKATLMNLRKMTEVGVPGKVIGNYLSNLNPGKLLPIDFIKAQKYSPAFEQELDSLMIKALEQFPKLSGHTVFIIDMSGSMHTTVSSKSYFTRLDAAISLAIMMRGVCEEVTIYATASNHQKIKPASGFSLKRGIEAVQSSVGMGGIYTRRAIDYAKQDLGSKKADRVIVISDSQDCDHGGGLPSPFGKFNYIIDVSSHRHGINYSGIWTQEISGWSPHAIEYIHACETFDKNAEPFTVLK